MAVEIVGTELWDIFPVNKFSDIERTFLETFDSAAKKRISKIFSDSNDLKQSSLPSNCFKDWRNLPLNSKFSYNFMNLYGDILRDINVHKLWKKNSGHLICAFYVWILHLLKMHLKPEDFKYNANEGYYSYRSVYGSTFDSETAEEQIKLFQTANWMSVFFHLVPAEHNTCLAMKVVTKFLEGWEGNYEQFKYHQPSK